jgi:hypothetical protein
LPPTPRINAKPAAVVTALTTTDGVSHWWTDDAEVGRDIGAPAILRFGAIEVTFLIDRLDRQGIEMTCVAHKRTSRSECSRTVMVLTSMCFTTDTARRTTVMLDASRVGFTV